MAGDPLCGSMGRNRWEVEKLKGKRKEVTARRRESKKRDSRKMKGCGKLGGEGKKCVCCGGGREMR